MEVNSWIILNIIVLIVQILVSFTKFKNYGMILIIITSICFLIFKQENLYNLALTQLIIYISLLIVNKLFLSSLNKKTNKEIEKVKIKDL